MLEGLVSGFVPGSRAPFSMDLLAVSMLIVVPTLTTALWLAKRRRYAAHKSVQVGLSLILLLVIVVFELEIRFSGWTQHAEASSLYDTWLFPILWVHLSIAITTTVLWCTTLYLALKNFPKPPKPGSHSRLHLRLARPAAFGMYLTSITGWTFYWAAFLA